MLVEAGVPLTVLRANFFMNHLLKTELDSIDKEGFFSNPLGSTRNSFVCTNDIGEAAAVCIEEGPERHANKFYDLTGPEPQSMFEIAAVLGKALGKALEYRPQSFSDFEKDFGPTRAFSSTSATDSTRAAARISTTSLAASPRATPTTSSTRAPPARRVSRSCIRPTCGRRERMP